MQFHCYCDNEIEIKLKDEYLLDAATIDSIRSGDFQSVECDRCGKNLKPELPVKFRTDNGRLVHFIPENERFTYEKQYSFGSDDYCVIGYPELMEFISICESTLEKEAVELVKLQIIQKVPDPSEIKIFFNEIIDANLVFHIHGLKQNEIGVIKIPAGVYAAVKKDISSLASKEPYKSIISKPYVSIRKHIEDEVSE